MILVYHGLCIKSLLKSSNLIHFNGLDGMISNSPIYIHTHIHTYIHMSLSV